MDKHSKKQRSYNMAQIRNKNSAPEMYVRKYLHKSGFRYSLHKKTLPGKPDIFLRKFKTAIFINGCFWHMHENCKKFVMPKTRTEWWSNKLKKNVDRDQKAINRLIELGYKVVVVWECELNTIKKREARLSKLIDEIRNPTENSV